MKKCAIYSRVSTSMQNEAEYSSCDAQKDRIMSYIKSQEDLEFTKKYSDTAFSGKDLERPSLQKFESLSRISQDKQYIENLLFRLAYKSPHPIGLELTGESLEKLVTRVQQVLIEFKKKTENSSQVEKCLAFEKIIQKIKISKDSLEVVISIGDTTNDEILKLAGLGAGKVAARFRGEHPNFCAPHCIVSSKNNIMGPAGLEPATR